MKKSIFFLATVISLSTYAQTVVVEKSKESVLGEKVDVLKTTLLIADSRKVEKQWMTFQRKFGKPSLKEGIYTVEEAVIDGITASVTSGSTITSYSRVTLKEEGTEIWWVLSNEGKFINEGYQSGKFDKMNKMLHQFGIDVYVNEINEDIEEADRVIDNAAKEYDRLIKQSDNLDKRLEKNGYERIRLEEKLVENLNDSTQIILQIKQNDLDQENALKEIEKLKQARESIRSKLEDVK